MDLTAAPGRRLRPRIIDTDWLVLRGLSKTIRMSLSANMKVGTRLLDFGCGSMPYRELVDNLGGRYIGADFGEEADVSINSDGFVAQNDASVDIVLSVQVLEHVRNLDRYFSEVSRVLTPEGKLILSTHGTWLYHPHPEDHRRWTRPGLKNEIESRGFKVTHCEPIVGPLAWTTLVRLTGFAYALRKVPVIGKLATMILALVMNLRALIEDVATPYSITADNACVYLIVARNADFSK